MALGFPGHLIDHRLRASFHNSLNRLHRLEEAAGSAKALATSAFVPAGARPGEAATKTGWLDRLTRNDGVKAGQFIFRLVADGRPDRDEAAALVRKAVAQ